VRMRSRGQLLAYESELGEPVLPPEQLERARALAVALDRAGRFGVLRPRCLVRSVALHHLLRRAGIPGSRIRIGVRPDSEGLDAHAWVTLANRVLGDDPRFVGRFTEIADARLAGLS
jgi:transglutaminase superfamily protein